MLIRIEEGTHGANWVVMLDSYPVKCSSWLEARDFADKMQSRLNAPHELPEVDSVKGSDKTRRHALMNQ